MFWCGVRFQDGSFVVVSVLIHCEDTERDFRDLRTGWGLGYFTEHKWLYIHVGNTQGRVNWENKFCVENLVEFWQGKLLPGGLLIIQNGCHDWPRDVYGSSVMWPTKWPVTLKWHSCGLSRESNQRIEIVFDYFFRKWLCMCFFMFITSLKRTLTLIVVLRGISPVF